MFGGRTTVGWAKLLSLALVSPLVGCDGGGSATIPAGTVLTVSLDRTLSTRSSSTGNSFVVNTIEPAVVNGSTVIPAGAIIHGYLGDVRRPGGYHGPARLTLCFTELEMLGGATCRLNVAPVTIEPRPTNEESVQRIAAGSVPPGGLLNGFIRGREAPIGSVVGPDGIAAVSTIGRHLTLEPGQRILIRTAGPVEVPASKNSRY